MRSDDAAATDALVLAASSACWTLHDALRRLAVEIDEHPRIARVMRDALETAGCVADCGHGTEVNGK